MKGFIKSIKNNNCSLSFRILLTAPLLLCLALPASAGSVAYTYDNQGRLKTATYSTGTVITYYYDAAGNRTSKVTSGTP